MYCQIPKVEVSKLASGEIKLDQCISHTNRKQTVCLSLSMKMDDIFH